MRAIFTFVGITIGSFGGVLAGGFAGWVILRIIDGPNALSNPDLPGGMAWLFVFILAAVGLLGGGILGVRLGKHLFRQWQTDSHDFSEPDL
jgi:hypothetical protein